jgi:hypothetical protein
MADTNLLVLAREFKNLRTYVQEVLKMPVGPQGLQGETGEQGVKGDKGAPGKDGKDGKDGLNGVNGQDGKNGVDGENGKDGLDGVGVQNAYIDFDNSLVIVLTDGREINAGFLSQEAKDSVVATFKQGAQTLNELLPEQTGNAGKFLTTDGTTTSWATAGGGGSPFTSPVEINVNSTSSALVINQLGTGNALLVEDSSNPDTTPTVIDQFGNLIIGKDSRFAANGNKLEIHSTISETNGILPSVGLFNWSSSASAAPHISFRHYPSGTVGTTTTANASGDTLGRIRFFTQDGAGNSYSGGISATTASDLVSVNLSYSGNSHTFTGAITSSRIDPRVSSTASTATLTPNISTFDQYNLTAQAVGLTLAAPTGTPVDGNKLIIRILDNGTPQTITWNGTYTVIGMTLPTTTTANKMIYVGCIYNSANTRWDVIALAVQA